MINPNYIKESIAYEKAREAAQKAASKEIPEKGSDVIGDLPYDVANEILEKWMTKPVSLVTKSYSGQSIAATCFDLVDLGRRKDIDALVEILREAIEQAGKSEEAAEEWEFYRGD